MPPPSPVLGGSAGAGGAVKTAETQYGSSAAATVARRSSSVVPASQFDVNLSTKAMNNMQQQQHQLHSSFNSNMNMNMNTSFMSSTSTASCNNVSERMRSANNQLDYLSSTTTTIDLSPNPRFAQDYPIFTPLGKSNYEEVAVGILGSTPPPADSSSKSGDSLEALRDEDDWLSPLVLDDAALPHALDFQFPLHPPASSASTARLSANHQPPPGTASATLLHRPKLEPRPYHITSIHPNRGPMLTHKRKPRIRSAEFSRHATYPDWTTATMTTPHFTHKKPLSELITTKLKHNSTHPSALHANSQHHSLINDNSNNIHANANNATRRHPLHDPTSASLAASSDNGCMQSCDKCLPGSRMTVVPITDSCDYTDIPPKERDFTDPGAAPTSKPKGTNNPFISWFRSKKKPGQIQSSVSLKGSKSQGNKVTSNQAVLESILTEKERVNIAAVKEKLMNLEEGKDSLEMAVNTMKHEVSQANEKRDAALVEVFELRLSMEEMGKKIESLESYCQSLQNATKNKRPTLNNYNLTRPAGYGDQNMQDMNEDEHDQMLRAALAAPNANSFTGPSKKEFYHAVTEARVGVKQFCRTLLQQVQEQAATEKIESILQPYNVKVATRVSKVVRYHLESLINEAFYEDFENIKFQKSGTNCVLDPRQRPHAFYKTYLGMSQMGWSELVSKESAIYSQSFDSFCDHKMNKVEQVLNWEGRWPDDLARSFFVAAKWVWLLHLLAFSFHHPALIFRVGCEAHFDSQFMEEIPLDQQSSKVSKLSSTLEATSSLQIKVMVMPGFFFNNYEVIKCKILLSRQQVITTN